MENPSQPKSAFPEDFLDADQRKHDKVYFANLNFRLPSGPMWSQIQWWISFPRHVQISGFSLRPSSINIRLKDPFKLQILWLVGNGGSEMKRKFFFLYHQGFSRLYSNPSVDIFHLLFRLSDWSIANASVGMMRYFTNLVDLYCIEWHSLFLYTWMVHPHLCLKLSMARSVEFLCILNNDFSG